MKKLKLPERGMSDRRKKQNESNSCGRLDATIHVLAEAGRSSRKALGLKGDIPVDSRSWGY